MGLLYLMGESAFNPRTLFANNEQGLWLDPSDFSTMWQDAAGDTPVTAASDPVALILDKSRSGPSMGSNQVTNGGFGADSDWTKGTGWTIGSGVATKAAGSASLLSQAQTMTAGRYYIVTYTITRTAGSITPQFAGGSTVSGTARSTSGTFTDIMTVASGNNTLQLSADASFAGTVDNVSLKELSAGNHAYQTTSASRPTLQTTGGLWYLSFDGSDDSLVTNAVDFNTWTQETRRNLLTDTESLGTWSQTNTTNGSWVAGVATVTDVEGFTYGDRAGTYNTVTDHVLSFNVVCNQTVANVPIRAAGTTSVSALLNLTAGVAVRVTLTGYRPFAGGVQLGLDLRDGVVSGGSNTTGYTLTFSQAQMEIGTSATAYQRVGTDEMTVIAGVRKLSDAADGTLVELSVNAGSNAGSFIVLVPERLIGSFSVYGRGAAAIAANQRSVVPWNNSPAPVSAVIASAGDISGDSNTLRANSISQTAATGDQGAGNYGNYQLFIGRRGGSSDPFNGHIYQLIIRGKTTPTGKLLEAERFVGKKTGVAI